MKIKKICLFSSIVLYATSLHVVTAAEYNWNGTTSNLALNTNWTPATVPVAGDIGDFGTTGADPTLGASASFGISKFNFDGTHAFNVGISGAATFEFSNPGSLVNSGVNIQGANTQTFNLTTAGTLTFSDDTSSDATSSGHSVYNLNGTNTAITFQDTATAKNSSISSVSDSLIFFKDNSQANNSTINSNLSSITFSENSQANSSHINSNGGTINFNDACNLGTAAITGTNFATITFFTPGGNASLSLTNSSGAVLIRDCTLGSISGDSSSPFDLSNFKLTVGTNNQTTEFAGNITDRGPFGSVVKVGTGTLTLSGTSFYTGDTTIQQGELKLNGFLDTRNLMVKSGGVFSGNGILQSSCIVEAGGFISPGSSIGTLTVNGNYIQSAGSTYILEINGVGATDLVDITGTATINGGVVSVTSLDGQALYNTPYTFVHASGVVGQFSGVVNNNVNGIPVLLYDPQNVYLLFLKTISGGITGLTPNEQVIADQFNGITNPTPEELLILTVLTNLPAEEQQKALDQLSGQQYASLNMTAEIAGDQFLRRLYDPLRTLVTTVPCTNGCGCNDENSCGCGQCSCGNLDTWFEVGGGQSLIHGNRNANSFKLNGYSLTLGAQTTFDCDWTIGTAVSYAQDNVKYDVGGNSRNENVFGAVYGLYRPSNFYVLGDLAFGASRDKMKRHIEIGNLFYEAKSTPIVYQGLAYIEAGYDFPMCQFLIQPFVGLEGGYFKRKHICEHGASILNLSVAQQTYGNAHSRLGLHMTTQQLECLSLSVDLAWQYRLTSFRNRATQSFQTFGDPFEITGIPGKRNSIDAAVTFSTMWSENLELFAEVEGQFWAKTYNYSVLGGVQFTW